MSGNRLNARKKVRAVPLTLTTRRPDGRYVRGE